MMRPARVLRSAVVLKTSTLLHFHKMLIQQNERHALAITFVGYAGVLAAA
jgi:hypothetical protein